MGTYTEGGFTISYGKPYPLGATYLGDDVVNFAVVMSAADACGVILYNRSTKETYRFSFCCSNRLGNVCCMQISGIDPLVFEYNYYCGDEVIPDPYAKVVLGNDRWGELPQNLRCGIYMDDYDWEDDTYPLIPYNEAVFYLLHVRGFTKHKSSLVSSKGTYEGVISKIPYLIELGITTIEIMPAYNFIELQESKTNDSKIKQDAFSPIEPKLNYWGYKESYYFAPKSSYSASKSSPVNSFKNLVKELHRNGIELIMQFYFPKNIKQGYIFEVLKFWMQEYHVDGFHLYGNSLPLSLLCTEPMLANTKIISEGFPIDDIYESGVYPQYKNLATSTDEYMYDMRRLLKSDEGMVYKALEYMKSVPSKTGNIHYFSHGNTFTLMDVVSYDKKHNEINGEYNKDGSAYNGSWNCGYEGVTSKKTVKSLRLKQIKNAIVLNMISKSTPLIVAGDEFGNTQKGNNNPYCQDNSITWLNWNDLRKNSEIYDFTKSLISLRKQYKILHSKNNFMMNDYLQCGCPDLSFHCEEAWRVNTDALSREFGLLYNGIYEGEPVYIYVAVNLHWTNHDFAIPKLSKVKWEIVVDTSMTLEAKQITSKLNVKERSIVILLAR